MILSELHSALNDYATYIIFPFMVSDGQTARYTEKYESRVEKRPAD